MSDHQLRFKGPGFDFDAKGWLCHPCGYSDRRSNPRRSPSPTSLELDFIDLLAFAVDLNETRSSLGIEDDIRNAIHYV